MHYFKKIPFHPIIFAPYPVLALAVANLSWVPRIKFYWALGLTYLAMLIILGTSWLLVKNIHKAAAITTLCLLLFFTYGHIYGLVAKDSNPSLWLTFLWIVILVGGILWILSLSSLMQDVTRALNWTSILLLIFPLFTWGVYYLRESMDKSQSEVEHANFTGEGNLLGESPNTLPDIYFIVLDGYARADILADIYDYNNQPLLDYLRDHGFYVAEESFANYHHTVLSLSTTLNMTYIKELLSAEGIKSYDYWEIIDHIHNNKVFDLASAAGYELVVFSSGQSITNIHPADHTIRPEMKATSGTTKQNTSLGPFELELFETKLLETTALRPALPSIFKNFPEDPRYEDHRQYILNTFSNLSAFAQEEGSYFVFAYVLSPHPPFVFDANGEPKPNWRIYTVSDGSHWVGGIGTRSEYIKGYREQINYINSLLIDAIDEILTQSETPPVIIIQGDHGPGAYFEWQSLGQTNLRERMTILNALYLPGGDDNCLYPSISPINTFRVIFNRYLGGDFKLVEDRAYFSKWGRPFEFTDVTEQLLVSPSP